MQEFQESAPPRCEYRDAFHRGCVTLALTEASLQAYHGHAQALEVLLLQGGTQVDQQDEAGRTPLVLAATRGHADCVRTLLSQGASPSSTTTQLGQTAVHHAGGWSLNPTPNLTRTQAGRGAREGSDRPTAAALLE